MQNMFKSVTAILSLTLLFLISACGSAQNPGEPVSAPTAQPPAASAATKTIKHAMGTVEIKGTPKRIVTLEWVYAEDLLALGVQPTGVADIAGYKRNFSIQPQLAAETVDVGTRQESNLESIAGLKPDLIITSANRAKQNYEQLKKSHLRSYLTRIRLKVQVINIRRWKRPSKQSPTLPVKQVKPTKF